MKPNWDFFVEFFFFLLNILISTFLCYPMYQHNSEVMLTPRDVIVYFCLAPLISAPPPNI